MDRSPGPGADGEQRRHRARALADPTRFAVFRALESADGPMTVAELTEAVGVHHTAVRSHLAQLCDAGFIAEEQAPPAGRGRPKLLYRWLTDDPGGGSSGAYEQLSRLLATAVRTGRSARDVGRDAGRDAGRLAMNDDPVDTVDLIETQATSLGFEPTRRGSARRPELVLGHCPFSDVAADDPETICSLHLGIAEGIADAAGGVAVRGMAVRDPYRAGCRLQLERLDPDSP